MKEHLDEESRLGLIHYRIERSDEAIEEAAILAERCHYNAAVNRLYYACFYAVQALLLKTSYCSINPRWCKVDARTALYIKRHHWHRTWQNL